MTITKSIEQIETPVSSIPNGNYIGEWHGYDVSFKIGKRVFIVTGETCTKGLTPDKVLVTVKDGEIDFVLIDN